jgi:WD40 repeat protein
LASAGDDRTVRVWTLQQRQQQQATFVCTQVLKHPRTPPHLGSKVQCVSFSPVDNNGSTLASGSEDGRVRLWQTDTGTLLRIFRGFHFNSIMALTFSPSGDAVAFGGSDQTIRIKNLQDESRQSVEITHPINAIAFSPITNASRGRRSSSILAVGCQYSSTIRLFSTTQDDDTTNTTLTYIGNLEGHSNNVTSLVFLNDHSLISASEDSTIRQWDLHNMTCVSTQKSRASRCLLSIAISPDQTTLASGNITRNLSFWRL